MSLSFSVYLLVDLHMQIHLHLLFCLLLWLSCIGLFICFYPTWDNKAVRKYLLICIRIIFFRHSCNNFPKSYTYIWDYTKKIKFLFLTFFFPSQCCHQGLMVLKFSRRRNISFVESCSYVDTCNCFIRGS